MRTRKLRFFLLPCSDNFKIRISSYSHSINATRTNETKLSSSSFQSKQMTSEIFNLFSQSSSPSSRGDKQRSTRPSIAADLRSLWNRLSVEEVPVLTSVFDASIPLPGSKESRLRTRRSRISRNSRSSFQLALLSFFPPSTSEILPPSWRNLRKFWKED